MKRKYIFAVFTALLVTAAVSAGCGGKIKTVAGESGGKAGFENAVEEGTPASEAGSEEKPPDFRTEGEREVSSHAAEKHVNEILRNEQNRTVTAENSENPGDQEVIKTEPVSSEKSSEKHLKEISENNPDQSSEKIQNNLSENTTEKSFKDRIIPGINAPEPVQNASATEEKPKLSAESEAAVRQVLESSRPEAAPENSDSGIFYPIITTGGTPIPVYEGPGFEYERKYDNGSPAGIPSSMLALHFPVTLLGRTENGWLHISYKSKSGRYAYEIAEEHEVEGYVQEGYLISESDNQERIKQQEEAAKNNQKVLEELEKEQEKAEKKSRKDLEEAEIGQEKVGKNEQEKEEENELEEYAKKEEQKNKKDKTDRTEFASDGSPNEEENPATE